MTQDETALVTAAVRGAPPRNPHVIIDGVRIGIITQRRAKGIDFMPLMRGIEHLAGWHDDRKALSDAARATITTEQLDRHRREADEIETRNRIRERAEETALHNAAEEFRRTFPTFASRFDTRLTLDDVVRIIRDRIKDEARSGSLPTPCDYRVSIRRARYRNGTAELMFRSDHFATHDAAAVRLALERLALDYHRPEGTQDGCAFRVRAEAADALTKADIKTMRNAGATYDAILAASDQLQRERMLRAGFSGIQVARAAAQ